jgi:glycosyltransferase involved in cell wall biosynthesis
MPIEQPATGVAPSRPGTLLAVRHDSAAADVEWRRILTELATADVPIVLLHRGSVHAEESALVSETLRLPSASSWNEATWDGVTTEILRLHEVCAILVSAETPTSEVAQWDRVARTRDLRVLRAGESPSSDIIADCDRARLDARDRLSPRRIAFVGTRGVPSRYSGFETFVEQLGARLAAAGDEVTVYARRASKDVSAEIREAERTKSHRGMKLVYLFAPRSKHLETIVHTFLSMMHLLFRRRHDAVIVCGVGNAPFFWIPRLRGMRVICNVDGSDWKRGKWGRLAKAYLRLCERIAARSADVLVADARAVRDQYLSDFGRASRYVAYGSERPAAQGLDTLQRFGLEPDRYLLFVGRLVPENGAHRLIAAYRQLDSNLPLVIVGDATYAEDYKRQLRQLAGENSGVIFTGYQFEDDYHQLSANARAFVLASSVGGTHPVLVEQMAFGNAILAHDTAANREVLGQAGLIYSAERSVDDLRLKLEILLEDHELRHALGRKAAERARRHYSWEAVLATYSALIDLAERPAASGGASPTGPARLSRAHRGVRG